MPLNTKIGLSTPVFVFTLVFLPFMGYFMHQLKNIEKPPPDFGSGSMFDQIATRYDMINRVLALRMDVGWRKEMSRRVRERLPSQNDGPVRLLDVATGTADVALQLAADIPSSTIMGVDPSNNMLEVGRAKIAEQGLSSRIELVTGDARDFSNWNADTFDAATMAFGIRNVPERDVALCQILRLLKPSGTVGILEFSEPDDSHGVLGFFARLFIRHIVPIVGGILSGAPKEYAHLQNSIKDFPTPPQFRELMQNLSCEWGHFDMEPIVHMNFGSVQLYIGSAVKPEPKVEEMASDNETH